MNDEKDQQPGSNEVADQQNQETLHVKNPFKPGEEKEITREELDREQEFKEALTERD